VDAVERAIDAARPDVVADLGGGTGFILEELLKRGLQGVRLVNVEVSPKQVAVCKDDRIITLRASMDKVTRSQLQSEDAKLMLIARSVLHYFGRLGIGPLLRHLRGQLQPGEYFVHQSAAFSTVDELKSRLENAGFIVHEVVPASRLEMSSVDLGERYGLNPEQRASIGREIEGLFGRNQEVFACDGNEFKASLHAFIFSCEAE
jgi:predicted TPR repeat methyltransferase